MNPNKISRFIIEKPYFFQDQHLHSSSFSHCILRIMDDLKMRAIIKRINISESDYDYDIANYFYLTREIFVNCSTNIKISVIVSLENDKCCPGFCFIRTKIFVKYCYYTNFASYFKLELKQRFNWNALLLVEALHISWTQNPTTLRPIHTYTILG